MTGVTLDELADRCAAIPHLLRQTAELPIECALAGGSDVKSWDVVGVGASEGPARLFVAALESFGIAARLCPVTSFLTSAPDGSPLRERGLVVFSQGLSPNARLALDAGERYRACYVVTAVAQEAKGVRAETLSRSSCQVLRHLPKEEAGSLLRVMGPAAASLSGLRLAVELARRSGARPEWASLLAEVPSAYERPSDGRRDDDHRCDERPTREGSQLADALQDLGSEAPGAFVAMGFDTRLAAHFAWKWQEAVYRPVPPVFDPLSFAHGPLQSFFDRPRVFVTLTRAAADSASQDVWARFREAVALSHHRVIELSSNLPGPLAFFEWDASWLRQLLSVMVGAGVSPGSWPGMSGDGALYRLGESEGEAEETD